MTDLRKEVEKILNEGVCNCDPAAFNRSTCFCEVEALVSLFSAHQAERDKRLREAIEKAGRKVVASNEVEAILNIGAAMLVAFDDEASKDPVEGR